MDAYKVVFSLLLLYSILVTAGGSLAETGAVPPIVGVWAPLVLATVSAVSLVLKANGTRLSLLSGTRIDEI